MICSSKTLENTPMQTLMLGYGTRNLHLGGFGIQEAFEVFEGVRFSGRVCCTVLGPCHELVMNHLPFCCSFVFLNLGRGYLSLHIPTPCACGSPRKLSFMEGSGLEHCGPHTVRRGRPKKLHRQNTRIGNMPSTLISKPLELYIIPTP